MFLAFSTKKIRLLIETSKNAQAALNRHKAELKFGKHRDKKLQADWQRLGEVAFTFKIIETLSPPKDQPNYDPSQDLEELLEMVLERDTYAPDKLYKGRL